MIYLIRDGVVMDIFRPDIYKQSIYHIDFLELKTHGIKCILFDLDNTLVPIDVVLPDKRLLDFFMYLEDLGFKVIILSNSSKKRVQPFKEKCNVDSSFHSRKPLKAKYLKILELYHYKDTEIACIGDQLITDILGANRMGFTSILVNPISSKEKFGTKINKKKKKIIYKYLKKRGLLEKGVYYD